MANFRLFFNRVIVNWHIILVFTICLISIHFFFLNDYHLQVKESLSGHASEPAVAQTTEPAPEEPVYFHLHDDKEGETETLVESHASPTSALPKATPHAEPAKTEPVKSEPVKSEPAKSKSDEPSASTPTPEHSKLKEDDKALDTAVEKVETPQPHITHGEEYLAICVSMKDQERDLPEWLVHHYHHVGIRRF